MRYNIEFNKRQDDQLKELKERIGAKILVARVKEIPQK